MCVVKIHAFTSIGRPPSLSGTFTFRVTFESSVTDVSFVTWPLHPLTPTGGPAAPLEDS
jgi:hypothetical protein